MLLGSDTVSDTAGQLWEDQLSTAEPLELLLEKFLLLPKPGNFIPGKCIPRGAGCPGSRQQGVLALSSLPPCAARQLPGQDRSCLSPPGWLRGGQDLSALPDWVNVGAGISPRPGSAPTSWWLQFLCFVLIFGLAPH